MAILKTAVFGSHDCYPLTASGDARAGTMAACYHLERELVCEEKYKWAREAFKEIARIVGHLPNDTSTNPDNILSTIERARENVLGEFSACSKIREDLDMIQSKWKRILPAEFQTQ